MSYEATTPTFSSHARERMELLGITEQEVIETIHDRNAFRGTRGTCMQFRRWRVGRPELNLVYDPLRDHVVTVGFCATIGMALRKL